MTSEKKKVFTPATHGFRVIFEVISKKKGFHSSDARFLRIFEWSSQTNKKPGHFHQPAGTPGHGLKTGTYGKSMLRCLLVGRKENLTGVSTGLTCRSKNFDPTGRSTRPVPVNPAGFHLWSGHSDPLQWSWIVLGFFCLYHASAPEVVAEIKRTIYTAFYYLILRLELSHNGIENKVTITWLHIILFFK